MALSNKILLVTGSRTITDAHLVTRVLDQLAAGAMPAKLVHGGARGVDRLAGDWAEHNGIPVQVIRPAHPRRKQAYVERDYKLVDMADAVVAIWDGASAGTTITADYARRKNKLIHLHDYSTRPPQPDADIYDECLMRFNDGDTFTSDELLRVQLRVFAEIGHREPLEETRAWIEGYVKEAVNTQRNWQAFYK